MTWTLLLFEDLEDEAQLVLNALRELKHTPTIEVVWFRTGFLELDEIPRSIVVPSKNAPTIYTIANGHVNDPREGETTWFPAQFDAALLDVFIEHRNVEAGAAYVRLLADVDFRGPVAVASRRDRDSELTKPLRNAIFKQKRDDGAWANDAVRWLNAALLKSRARAYNVNARGRRQDSFMSDFLALPQTHAPSPESQIYVGEDTSASKKLAKFFALTPWQGRDVVPFAEMSTAISEAWDTPGRRPHVIWVECGESFDGSITDAFADTLFRCFGPKPTGLGGIELQLDPVPALFVLAERDSRDPDKRVIERCNGVHVKASELLECPLSWTLMRFSALANAYDEYLAVLGKRLDEDEAWQRDVALQTAALRLMDCLLCPFAMARSVQRIYGTPSNTNRSWMPSLARWTDPTMETRLNTTFKTHHTNLVRKLFVHKLISLSQAVYHGR